MEGNDHKVEFGFDMGQKDIRRVTEEVVVSLSPQTTRTYGSRRNLLTPQLRGRRGEIEGRRGYSPSTPVGSLPTYLQSRRTESLPVNTHYKIHDEYP